MSKREKLDRDYQESVALVERLAKEGVAEVRRKADEIKREAESIGADVERSLGEGKKKG